MSSSFQQINIEELESVSFGDKDFKKELIEIFLDQIPTFIKNMNQFFADGKIDLLAKEAHTAKSSVLIFGMKKTGSSLKEIQLQGEKNITDELSSLIASVEEELKVAEQELKQILASL